MKRFILTAAAAFSMLLSTSQYSRAETALLAGGCFWCVESDLESVPGVRSVVSGYAGGEGSSPTYKTYAKRGFREVVQVDFDESKINYRALLDIFLRTIDVTDAGGQFCDRGHAYSSAIYALDAKQESAAKKAAAEAGVSLGKPIQTPIEPPARFWAAEDYHQDYYKSATRTLTRFGYVKRSDAYKGYRNACGRDETVKRVWGSQAYRGVPAHDS